MNSIHDDYAKVNPQNPYHGKVTVVKLYPCHQAGPIKAFVTIRIGEALEIRSLKVIQQDGQRAYVKLPDKMRTDGSKGYDPYVICLDERLAEEISRVVLAAWQNGGAA